MRSLHVIASLAIAGCAGGVPPELAGLDDQVAGVGTELRFDLLGYSPSGGELTYDVSARDLDDLAGHSELAVLPSGAGLFRWTPLAADVGVHQLDITVSDGDASTTKTIAVDVRTALGPASAPVFRQPLGTGTTLDLAASACVDLDIVIDDSDTPQVTIRQDGALAPGMQLSEPDTKASCPAEGCEGPTAHWHWCPTPAEAASASVFPIVFSADDGSNPPTLKQYVIALHGTPAAPACIDDASENDDTADHARVTTYPTWSAEHNQACPHDDDRFRVTLYTYELLTIDLTFTELDVSGDLDVHLYQHDVDLWPCDAQDPLACSAEHGQSASSNEHATFTVPEGCDTGCDYDVVVRGFDGASNAYAIRIAID